MLMGMAMQALDRASPLPLWAQLLADLRRRLLDGDLGEGDRLPTEERLGADYAVSRQTVREAIRRLRDSGLLTAERGRGTFVRTPQLVQPLGVLYSLFRIVEAQGLEQTSVVRALQRTTAPEIAARLGLAEAAPLVHLERLRLAGGEPLAHDRVWLPAEIAVPLLEVDFGHTALYDELHRRCGIHVDGGWERIRPVVPTDAERRLLGLDAQQAALAIDRLGRSGNRVVEWRSTLVRGDRYSLLVEWSPTSPYSIDLRSRDEVLG